MYIVRCALVAAGLLAAGQAMAQGVLIGKRLISRGDEVARVREAGGEPERIDRIDAGAGAPPMQIWSYLRRGRTVTLWIVDGRVAKVEESRTARN